MINLKGITCSGTCFCLTKVSNSVKDLLEMYNNNPDKYIYIIFSGVYFESQRVNAMFLLNNLVEENYDYLVANSSAKITDLIQVNSLNGVESITLAACSVKLTGEMKSVIETPEIGISDLSFVGSCEPGDNSDDNKITISFNYFGISGSGRVRLMYQNTSGDWNILGYFDKNFDGSGSILEAITIDPNDAYNITLQGATVPMRISIEINEGVIYSGIIDFDTSNFC